MKKIFMLFVALLYPIFSYAQGGLRITWPLERSVFQRNTSNQADFSIAGTFGYRSVFLVSHIQVKIYTLNPTTGTRINNTPVFNQQYNDGLPQGNVFTNSYNSAYGTVKTFKIDIVNFAAGWYEAEVSLLKYNDCTNNLYASAIRKVKFGIGDVYLIAGQSNASGYTYEDDKTNAVANIASPFQPDAVNILNSAFETDRSYFLNNASNFEKIKQDYGLPFNNFYKENYNEIILPFENTIGTPYYHKFDKLEPIPTTSSEAKINGSNNIYPNGQSSWAYGPMAYHLFNTGNTTPIMLFNAAIPGSHSKAWAINNDNDWVYHQFRGALQMFGHIYGLRKVLWHQGESDNGLFNEYSSTSQYQNNLQSVINKSRVDIGNSNLGWAIAKATFDGTKNPTTRIEVINAQGNLQGQTNNNAGPNTDVITSIGANGRANNYKVHFTGNALNTVGEMWKNSNIQGGSTVSGKALQNLDVVQDPNDLLHYQLKAPLGFNTYIWVKNNNGIFNAVQSGSNRVYAAPMNSDNLEIYTCYMSNATDTDLSDGLDLPLYVSQSFVVPNYIDAQQSLSTVLLNETLNSNATTTQLGINAKGVKYVISHTPNNWFTPNEFCGADGFKNLNINIAANNTGAARTCQLTITCDNGYIHNVYYTQLASTSIPLSSLSPSSATTAWGSVHYDGKNAAGNAMYVGGFNYTQGIGTHANSTITYNIPAGYTYFNGLVGRDDGADNCNCGTQKLRFYVKLNGNQAWNSGEHTPSTAAECFSINLNGATSLQLIADIEDGSAYGDWANWINPQLSNTPAACANLGVVNPPSITASPATINAGQSSTLTANCAAGTVAWATGQNTASISVSPTATTQYQARCVVGSNYSSYTLATVTVNGGGSCVSNNQVMGVWTVTGDQLITRYFHGAYWLVQKVNVNGSQYDEFVVRGSEMLQRGDVSPQSAGLISCYAWQYSAVGGLVGPSANTNPAFNPPTGYTLKTAADGTPYYTNLQENGGGTPPPPPGNCVKIKNFQYNHYVEALAGQAQVKINPANGSNSQIWKMISTDNVHFQFRSHDGRYMYSTVGPDGQPVSLTTNAAQANSQFRYDTNYGDHRFYLPANYATWDYNNQGTHGNLLLYGTTIHGYAPGRLWSLQSVSCPSGMREASSFIENNVLENEPEFLTVYPNPNEGHFKVNVYLNSAQTIKVYLSESSGKSVSLTHHKVKAGLNTIDFDNDDLPAGNYHLKVISTEKTESQKINIY